MQAETVPASGLASCGHQAQWRCLTCHGRPFFCTDCCRDKHLTSPLHRVEYWQGDYLQSAWLRQTGLEISCGHGGSPCPDTGPGLVTTGHLPADSSSATHTDTNEDDNEDVAEYLDEDDPLQWNEEDEDLLDRFDPDDDRPTIADLPHFGEPLIDTGVAGSSSGWSGRARMMTIVDTSGIHELPVVFCSCPNANSEAVQLLDLGYYPASHRRPRTAFTFRVLDDFLLKNKECKISPRSYSTVLRRTTNSAFPHIVPVRVPL